ncbi:MAG: 30S ribosomal protein S4 [Spirochaetota bacterium]
MNYTGPKVKLSRKLGIPLTPKAAEVMAKKPYPPGQQGRTKPNRRKESNYKIQLMEKQRLRAQYNIHEKQMKNYYYKANKKKGNTIQNLIQMLEMRLDAVVLRGGLAKTIYAARQYVSHKHITVNGKLISFPGFSCKLGDVVAVRERSQKLPCFVELSQNSYRVPYLSYSPDTLSTEVLAIPKREDIPVICNMSLVVEYYSR